MAQPPAAMTHAQHVGLFGAALAKRDADNQAQIMATRRHHAVGVLLGAAPSANTVHHGNPLNKPLKDRVRTRSLPAKPKGGTS